jgi:hypothetical protein
VDPAKAERAAADLMRTGQAPFRHYANLTAQMGEHEAVYTTAIMNGRRKLAAEVCIAAEEDLARQGVQWKLAKGETPGQPLEISLTPAAGEKADAARVRIRRAMRDRTGGNLEAAGMEDGGPPTLKDEGPPTVRDDHPPVEDPDGPKTDRKPPNVGPSGATPGAANRARPRLTYPNQREAGKAFTAEIKTNPNFEAAVVVDRRDGSARLCFGDENTTDVPFGEHFEQVKHYHPGTGVTTDIGHRTPSFDDLKILKDTVGRDRPEARSMIRWTDAGGVPHWTPYGVDGEKVWVRLPGASRKEFPISIFDNPTRGKIEYNLWVEEAMAGLKE